MYTSDQYNSRILEEYVMKRLEKTYGPDKERFLEKMRRGRDEGAIPAAHTIDPNEAKPPSPAAASESDSGH